MPSYPAGITMSNHALVTVSDTLRHRRAVLGTRWRRLSAGQQALLVVAYLRKGETYSDLAIGFGIGTTTVFRYKRHERHPRRGKSRGLGERPCPRLGNRFGSSANTDRLARKFVARQPGCGTAGTAIEGTCPTPGAAWRAERAT